MRWGRVCVPKKNSKGNDSSRHSKGPRHRNSAEHRRGMRTRSAIPTACRPPDSPEHREYGARCQASRRIPTSPWMGSCVEESGYLLQGGHYVGHAWPHFGLQGVESGVVQLWCQAYWGIPILGYIGFSACSALAHSSTPRGCVP